MRLSIEITREQHRYLKAIAALQGQTIKDYVLERTSAVLLIWLGQKQRLVYQTPLSA